MRYLKWALRLALFLLVLSFAVKNTDIVSVNYYLGYHWQAPLVLVLLVFFCLGVLVGVAANLAHMLRRRREVVALRRELNARSRVGEASGRPPDAAGAA
jgi:uncharacterized integral membrane protein